MTDPKNSLDDVAWPHGTRPLSENKSLQYVLIFTASTQPRIASDVPTVNTQRYACWCFLGDERDERIPCETVLRRCIAILSFLLRSNSQIEKEDKVLISTDRRRGKGTTNSNAAIASPLPSTHFPMLYILVAWRPTALADAN